MGITFDALGGEVADGLDGLDAAGFAALYARHRDALYRFCYQRAHDPDLVEDIVQDVFEKAFARRHRFDAGRDFWPWLLSIATRACIDARRRAVTAEARYLRYARITYREPSDVTSSTVLRTIDDRQLGRHIAALPPRQRAALGLFALDGCSYELIGRHLGYSTTAVKALIRRARATLRDATGRWVGAVVGMARMARARWHRRLQAVEGWVWPSFGTLGVTAGVLSNATAAVAVSLAVLGGVVSGATVDRRDEAVVAASLQFPISGPPASPVPVPTPVPTPTHGPTGRGPALGRPATASTEMAANQAVASVMAPSNWGSSPDDISTVSVVAAPEGSGDSTVFVAGDLATYRTDGRAGLAFDFPLLVSHDDAGSWRRARALGLGPVVRLLLPPQYPHDRRLFAVTAKGLQVSDDDGDTFVTLAPLVNVTDADVSPAFDADDPTVLMVAGGRLWQYRDDTGLATPLEVTGIPGAGDILSVAYSTVADDSRAVVVGARSTAATLGSLLVSGCALDAVVDGVELRRLDCSTSTQLASSVPTDEASVPMRLPPGGGSTLYLPLRDAQYLSTDGGRTFRVVRRSAFEPDYTENVFDIAVVPGSGGESAVLAQKTMTTVDNAFSWGPQLARTDDGGRHWTSITVPLPGFVWASRVVVTASGRIIAGGGARAGVACSADGGRTWGRTCPRSS